MTDKPQTTDKKKQVAYDKMAVAVGRYLETMGWNAALISGARIEKRGLQKMKFTFSCDFLGGKKDAKR